MIEFLSLFWRDRCADEVCQQAAKQIIGQTFVEGDFTTFKNKQPNTINKKNIQFRIFTHTFYAVRSHNAAH